MNGAQALIRTLVNCGVDTCFMNPGTSEMHFVAALDDVPEMHSVLALFEGVATGAADGYARVAGKPAAVLLHLGPGLGNGLANLHNARRGHTPIVNIVGDHATYHAQYDAPLQSDIAAIASSVSGWMHAATDATEVATDAAAAVDASMQRPGRVATLILPADVCWNDAPGPAERVSSQRDGSPVDDAAVQRAAAALQSGEPTALLIGGALMRTEGLRASRAVAETCGAKLLSETFPAIMDRGAGIPAVERLAYLAEFAQMQLDGVRHLIVAGAARPVSFFAYPGKPSDLVPEGCEVIDLADDDADLLAAMTALAAAVGSDGTCTVQAAGRPERPSGPLTAQSVCEALGALLPEGAVVADEGNTAGLFAPGATAGAPPHEWMCLTGGSIGYGMPVATGAGVALKGTGRRVVNLQADGSALYTIQSLWTQAREGLDVTTIILNNSSYAVLNMELARVGADPGPRALEMLDISRPDLDFVALANGLGVTATRATDAESFTSQLEAALATPGPNLIEAVIPATL
ncbi:MAG: acetolactate synthase large subunit [Actinomycetes bacterium]